MASAGTEPTAVSAPAGTGNAPGLGEAFSLDLNTGQGSYAVPIPLPDGVAGWRPELKLEYRHSSGNGPFGFGWVLPLRRIDRRLDFGVPDEGTVERFADSGAELVPVGDGVHRAAFESAFAWYRRSGAGWVVEERNGVRHELGLDPGARVADPDRPDRVVAWLLERSLDTSGNAIDYAYERDGGVLYVAEIRYATYRVRFSYGARPDPLRNGRAGFLRVTRRRCERIELLALVRGAERVVRSWTLAYEESPLSGVSLLAEVQLRSHGPDEGGAADVLRRPQRFGYTEPDPARWRARFMEADPVMGGPPPLSDPDTTLVALDDAPLPGVLQFRGGRYWYWRNAGDGRWSAPSALGEMPLVGSPAASGVQLLDVDGNATVDMLLGLGGNLPVGYFENGGPEGWGRFVQYPRDRRALPPFASGRARLADLDGDGRVDALYGGERIYAAFRNDGPGGWAEPSAQARSDGEAGPDADLAEAGVHFADMTGDGLPDLVRVRSGSVEYWPNLGHGRFGARVGMDDAPRLARGTAVEDLLLLDVDGDGCADLVLVDAGGVTVHFNRSGAGWSRPVRDPVAPAALPGTLRPADMTGRRNAGLLWNTPQAGRTGYVFYEFASEAPPYLLDRVENGAGLVSGIEYRSSVEDALRDRAAGTGWQTFLPFPVTVVVATRERDLVTGRQAESRYSYHDGHFDARTRQFQGFGRVEKREIGDGSRPNGLTVFHFRVGEDRKPGQGREAAALNRLLYRTEIFGLDGSPRERLPFQIEETEHELVVLDDRRDDGQQRVWVRVARTTRRFSERTDDERIEERRYGYDEHGNVVREELRHHGRAGGAAQPEIAVTTEVAYAVDAARNVLDRPARIVRRDGTGRLVAEVRRHYDGPDFVGLPLGTVERGLLTRETQWVLKRPAFDEHYGGIDPAVHGYHAEPDADGEPAVFCPKARRAYTATGALRAELSPAGAETAYTYDPSGLFRVERTGPLGATNFEFDAATGQPTRITEADGTKVEMAYDAQGRLTTVVLPGDSPELPSRTYAYDDRAVPHAVRVSYRLESGAPGMLETAIYFSGTMKEAQRRVAMATGRVVVSGHAERNPWDDPAAEFEPIFDADLAFARPPTEGRPARRFLYDALGRPVRTVDYSGGVSTLEIRPFETVARDANDNDASPENQARGHFNTPRRELFDAAHQRVAVVETGPGGAPVKNSFRVGPLGELLAHEDDRGVVARYTYDGRGNRLTIEHRDAGRRDLFHDAGRRTVGTRDATGTEIEARFDAADRIVELSVDGAAVESYAYGDVATGSLGLLREVTYPGGAQRFTYNGRGQIATRHWTFAGSPQVHTVAFAYNGLGKQRSVTYPDGTTVEYEHYANGVPLRIPGIVDRIDYDARMLPVRVEYANGVVSEIAYTPGPGRVARQRTSGPGGAVLEDQAFAYDALQQLLAINDQGPGTTGSVSLGYDTLGQLTRCDDARPASAGGGTTRYEYLHGRELSFMEESGTRLLYEDAAHPGRVSRLERGGAPDFAMPYDANGGILALPGRSFEYNGKGELARVVRDGGLTAEYTYDQAGRRVRKRVADGASVTDTLMLDGFAEIRNGALVRFVALGATRIAVLAAGGSTRWIHSNHLGSVTFFTDELGNPVSRIAYRPFGNVVGAPAPQDQVFALHEWDAEAGLYHMRRRYYAPELGRFVTPDGLYLFRPERGADDPRALGLYAYVANDPANAVDPSGRSFWSVFGAIVGVVVGIVVAVVVIAAFATGIGFGLLAIAGVVGLVLAGYGLASANAGTGFGEFMRGFLIGFNAGMNATLLVALGGGVLGVAVGVIGFLGAFDSIASSEVYQGILGWSNWLMPMSWLIVGLGVAFFALNLLGHVVTLGQVADLKVERISVDWKTGTIFMKGGWISNLNSYNTAFNMGNFAFVDRLSTSDHTEHEAGHTLNLAAYGSAFHLIGFVDEVILGNGHAAYAERLADSNDPAAPGERSARGDDPIIPQWV